MSEAGGPRRLWDWRLFLSIALVLAVVYIVGSGINAQREMVRKDQQVHDLVVENRDNTSQFTSGQSHLLADQHALLNYTAALAARQEAILAYLHRHGVRIPDSLLTPIPPPVLSTEGAPGLSAPPPAERPPSTSSAPHSPSSTPAPKPPAPTPPAPGATVSPTPKAPTPSQPGALHRSHSPAYPAYLYHPSPSHPSHGDH